MAVSVSVKKTNIFGTMKVVIAEIAFDTSYPAGGEPLTASDLGLTKIDHISIEPKSGYIFEYDYANSKVKAYYADYAAASAGPLIEVPDLTDLSAVTGVRVMAYGY
ncbi:hypothetical protein [Candidatus Pyrohabitans sp.]